MLPLSNYYNIGSESYFLNVPLFNYKVIFKYSYFIIPRILLCSLCHSPHYLTDSVFWRFSFISESAIFFCKSQCIQLPFSSSFPRQRNGLITATLQSHFSPSFVFFLQALISRAQQKPPRERHHSRPYNALLLPPQLHKCSSLTMSARVSFHLSSLFFHAVYSFVFISCFNLLVLHVCCMCPTKQWFLQSLQLLKCNRTHTMNEAVFC